MGRAGRLGKRLVRAFAGRPGRRRAERAPLATPRAPRATVERNEREDAMAKTVKEMLADARSAVPQLTAQDAVEKIRSGQVLVVDVRDGTEVQANGHIKGAV